MNDDTHVFSTAVRKRLDALREKQRLAEIKVRDIVRAIQELLVGQSPIGVGDRITFVSGSDRVRFGRVLAITTRYRGFEYRVAVLTKSGREIGQATVDESHHPTLMD